MLVKCQNCPHLFYLPNLREVIIPILLGEAVFVILSRMAVLHCLPDSNKPICCFLLAFSHPILTDVKEYRCIIDFFLFFSSLDDKVPGLVRDISCLTVASCLVTFRLACVETVGTFWFTALLKRLHTLARAKWLFQFKSVGDEWRDTFCTPLTLLRDLFIFECYRFHLKFEKRIFFYLKEKMPYETVLCLLITAQGVLPQGISIPAFPPTPDRSGLFSSMLVIFGSCLVLFQYPLLHLHLKKKSFLCILPLFSLGRRQKGGTACGRVTPFRPVNTKWGWENPLLCRPGAELKRWGDVWGIPGLGLEEQQWKTRQLCWGAGFMPGSLSALRGLLGRRQAGACGLSCSGCCTRSCRLVERLQGASSSLRTGGLTPFV